MCTKFNPVKYLICFYNERDENKLIPQEIGLATDDLSKSRMHVQYYNITYLVLS